MLIPAVIFTTVWFTLADKQKQSKCPWTANSINKLWYTQNGIWFGPSKMVVLTMLQCGWSYGHYIQWNKQDHKRTNVLWFHQYEISKKVKSKARKSRKWFPGVEDISCFIEPTQFPLGKLTFHDISKTNYTNNWKPYPIKWM